MKKTFEKLGWAVPKQPPFIPAGLDGRPGEAAVSRLHARDQHEGAAGVPREGRPDQALELRRYELRRDRMARAPPRHAPPVSPAYESCQPRRTADPAALPGDPGRVGLRPLGLLLPCLRSGSSEHTAARQDHGDAAAAAAGVLRPRGSCSQSGELLAPPARQPEARAGRVPLGHAWRSRSASRWAGGRRSTSRSTRWSRCCARSRRSPGSRCRSSGSASATPRTSSSSSSACSSRSCSTPSPA